MSEKEEWVAPDELDDVEDWPYDEEAEEDLVHELISGWDEIEEVDDYKYVEGDN